MTSATRHILVLSFVVMTTTSVLAAPAPTITVYKQQLCNCCDDWIKHLRTRGFPVNVKVVPDVASYRRNLGVADHFRSCHTATIESSRYVIEGHVPAREIERLLQERPVARGLSVPGMPHGSPGMEDPEEGSDAYDVLLLDKEGGSRVYASYDAVPAVMKSSNRAPGESAASDQSAGSGARVIKVIGNALLALLLGAGVMGIAYAHGKYDEKRQAKRSATTRETRGRLVKAKRRHDKGQDRAGKATTPPSPKPGADKD